MDSDVKASHYAATVERCRATFEAKTLVVPGFPTSTVVPTTGKTSHAGRRAYKALRTSGGALEPDLEIEDEQSGSALSKAAAGLPGIHVRLGAIIGEGGMGIVREATQKSMGRSVAVKSLREECFDEENTMRLLREAWLTGTLEHPNVLPVYDVSVDEDGMPLVVMRRIEGVDWADIIHDSDELVKRFGEGDRLEHNLRIFIQLCQVVAFAHSRGVVHRDIKPENVRIGLYGELYLLDWGLALALKDDQSGRFPLADDAQEMAGTPCYMAPEMLGGDMPPITTRTDVYLLAAVLYEMVCGSPPHDGDNMMAVISQVLASAPAVSEDVPATLRKAIVTCMASDPEARTMSVDELRDTVHEYLRERSQEQLFADVQEKLRELVERLASAETPAAKRGQVYDLLGACRFGFRNVVTGGGPQEAGTAGLSRALHAVARFELEQGDCRAAQTLCDEMDECPAGFRQEVAEALAAQVVRERRGEKLAHDFDKSVGRRTRVFAGVMLGSVTTLVPLFADVSPGVDVIYRKLFVVVIAALFVFCGVIVWARDSLSKTRFNRRTTGSVLVILVVQLLAVIGGYMSGIEPRLLLVLFPLFWAFGDLMVVVGVEWRLWPAAVAHVVGFLVGAAYGDWLYYAMAVSNFVLTCNVAAIWHDPRRDALASGH